MTFSLALLPPYFEDFVPYEEIQKEAPGKLWQLLCVYHPQTKQRFIAYLSPDALSPIASKVHLLVQTTFVKREEQNPFCLEGYLCRSVTSLECREIWQAIQAGQKEFTEISSKDCILEVLQTQDRIEALFFRNKYGWCLQDLIQGLVSETRDSMRIPAGDATQLKEGNWGSEDFDLCS